MLSKIFFVLAVFVSCILYGQDDARGEYRFMFYNVENLFDTLDNPDTHDEEFLAGSDKNWNSFRYWKKIKQLYQVIAAAGGASAPDIIGLCEIESFLPLYNLISNTPLSKYPYSIVHRESPDRRGIDVALLIRNDRIKLIESRFYPLIFPWDTLATTRELLLAKLALHDDTLNVLINHWPSQWGGEIRSEPRRLEASKMVMNVLDSINNSHPNSKIIVAGDFNDEPQSRSITQLAQKCNLSNLSELIGESCKCGSYKYKSEWSMIDQILVSQELLNKRKLYTTTTNIKILDFSFLLVKDNTYGGVKPYRTYLGPRYIGGFSDHLPIVLDLDYYNVE